MRGARVGCSGCAHHASEPPVRTLMSVMDMPQFCSSSMGTNGCGSCSYCGGRVRREGEERVRNGRAGREEGSASGSRGVWETRYAETTRARRTGRAWCAMRQGGAVDTPRRTLGSSKAPSSASAWRVCAVGSYAWVWVVGRCDCVTATGCVAAICASIAMRGTGGGERRGAGLWRRKCGVNARVE